MNKNKPKTKTVYIIYRLTDIEDSFCINKHPNEFHKEHHCIYKKAVAVVDNKNIAEKYCRVGNYCVDNFDRERFAYEETIIYENALEFLYEGFDQGIIDLESKMVTHHDQSENDIKKQIVV